MSCCCGDGTPTNTRITPDGKLQVSYDEGITWEDAPELDPRYTSVEFQPLPGVDGDDKKCNAAASAMTVIKDDIMAKLSSSGLGISMVALIAVIMAIYLSAGTLAPLVTALVSAAMGVGYAAVAAAFTGEVWETFKCILYCRMENDASFTENGWQLVMSDIDDQLTGIAADLLRKTVSAFGPIGMTNAARSSRAEDSDCSECGCEEEWCYKWNFLVASGGWVADSAVGAQWVSGQGWKSDETQGQIYIRLSLIDPTTVTSVRVKASAIAPNGGVGTRDPFPFRNSASGATEATFVFNSTTDEFGVAFDSNFSGGNNPVYNGAITEVEIRGRGVNPIGLDNCDE